VDLGDRIEELSIERKISFDGKSYHSRIPIEIVQTLEKLGTKIENVRWDGVWKNQNNLHIVLTFSTENNESDVTESENSEDDYVVLQ